MASASVKKVYDWQKAKVDRGYNYHGTPAYAPSINELQKLEAIANQFGFPFEWLANLINFESAGTFNPAVQNRSTRATGLIQFMPKTATGLGTSVDRLAKMTFEQQLPYVNQYLVNGFNKKLDEFGKVPETFNQTDLFMLIFYPVAVGKPNYSFPSDVVAANGGIRTPMDYTQKALKNPPFPDFPYTLSEAKKKNNSNVTTTTTSEKNLFGKWYFLVATTILFGTLVALSIYKVNKNT
jgi:hypothetical protein